MRLASYGRSENLASTSFGEEATLAFSNLLATVVCNKNHSFGGCAYPSTSVSIPCSHDIKGGGGQQVSRNLL
jgi:hypothetical protein